MLCYEPDPTKAKVLYESKVKDVIVKKDDKGRKTVEYLIHFRGWNPSWDRCVSEEFILKDTVENRQLQRDLAQKSKLQFGSYLYRKEQKKKTSPVLPDDGSCDNVVMEEEDENQELTSSEESSCEEDTIPLEVTPELRKILENDHRQIHERNKLHRLPALPSVVTILETYWKCYINNQKLLSEKGNNRVRNGTNGQREKIKPEVLQKNINIVQEFLDGLRIYFDFCLPDVLLYNAERGQTDFKQAQVAAPHLKIKTEFVKVENFDESHEFTQFTNTEEDEQNNDGDASTRPASRRRSLRSYRSLDTNSNGSVHSDSSVGKPASGNSADVISPLFKIAMWKALPDYVYAQEPKPPCLQYGATHLARLFVKLPELLSSTQMPENKMKVLITHLESFMAFLAEHKEWYTDDVYIHGHK